MSTRPAGLRPHHGTPVTDPGSVTAPLSPEALWSTVGLRLPADTLLVTEAGSNEFPIGACMRPGHPFSHLTAAGGGLGFRPARRGRCPTCRTGPAGGGRDG